MRYGMMMMVAIGQITKWQVCTLLCDTHIMQRLANSIDQFIEVEAPVSKS